jgi:phage baseplate assembly protein W
MIVYKDLNIKGSTDAINKDAVLQKLEILLNSYKNSNFFFREYECDIRDILFMPFTMAASIILTQRIRACIQRFIPELTIEKIIVVPDYDKRVHALTLEMTIDGSEVFKYTDYIEPKAS